MRDPTPTARPTCSYCRNRLVKGQGRSGPDAHHRLTRDHIMPKAWRRLMPVGVIVIRPACQACNELRALLGHCPAMLAIAKALADRCKYGSRREAARRLLLPVKGAR